MTKADAVESQEGEGTIPETQTDELDALEAIYGDDYRRITTSPACFSIIIRGLGEGPEDATATGAPVRTPLDIGARVSAGMGAEAPYIVVTLPPAYPEAAAAEVRAYQIAGFLGLGRDVEGPLSRGMEAALAAIATEALGAEAVYLLVEAAREWLQEQWELVVAGSHPYCNNGGAVPVDDAFTGPGSQPQAQAGITMKGDSDGEDIDHSRLIAEVSRSCTGPEYVLGRLNMMLGISTFFSDCFLSAPAGWNLEVVAIILPPRKLHCCLVPFH